MSASYNGRRGPNVSSYIENLNAMPATEEPFVDPFDPSELDIFTHAEFFDWERKQPLNGSDAGNNADNTNTNSKKPLEQQSPTTGEPQSLNFDFNDFADFDVSRFDYASATLPTLDAPSAVSPPQQQMPTPSVPASLYPAPTPSAPARPAKRKASADAGGISMEERSRLAAEEDKRRRNTAASARFRVKKKEKERQLEKTAREMTDRVASLEETIKKLEMENQFLKELLVGKNGGKSLEASTLGRVWDAGDNHSNKAEVAPKPEAK